VYAGDRFAIISGHKLFNSSDGLMLPATEEPVERVLRSDRSYRTIFGPCAAHSGYIIGNNAENINLGFTRMSTIRVHPEVERWYRDNQRRFVAENQDWFGELGELYAPTFQDYTTAVQEALAHYNDPHPKREVRVNAMLELLDTGIIGHRLWFTRLDKDSQPMISYKGKKLEFAKINKVMRMIADLGCPASLQGAWLTKTMKKAMEREAVVIDGKRGRSVLEFCAKPTHEGLMHVFTVLRTLYHPRYGNLRSYSPIFSDDSCIAIREDGEIIRYNVDISGCDRSHTGAMFDAWEAIHPEHLRDEAHVLTEQCEQRFRVADPNGNSGKGLNKSKAKITFQPKEATLFSGATPTTALNNLASMCIHRALVSHPGKLDLKGIAAAAARVGYVVTAERCDILEDLQFLKNSPVRTTDGTWVFLLNPGVFLRSSGMCKGELPAGERWEVATAFQKALVQGMYPRAHSPFLERIRLLGQHTTVSDKATRAIEKQIADVTQFKVGRTPAPELYFTDEDIFRRYRATEAEIAQITEGFGQGVGYHHCSEGLTRVLQKDYGLTGVSLLEESNELGNTKK